jgi:hypothetical protein
LALNRTRRIHTSRFDDRVVGHQLAGRESTVPGTISTLAEAECANRDSESEALKLKNQPMAS